MIEKALHTLDGMLNDEERSALLLKAEISEEEVERWRDINQRMTIPIGEDGIIHQFEGYMDLEELDWDEYRRKYDKINRLDRILKAEGLSPDSYKVAKQADTLMLFYVLNESELKTIFERLGYRFDKNTLQKNFDYYFPRTAHGSTLSMVAHARLAQLLGRKEQAMDHFLEALRSDIYDTQGGTTQEGIHMGVMGGTLDLFLHSFAGLNIWEDRICLDPKLPQQWESIKFRVRYKNIWFDISIAKKKLTVTAKPFKETSLTPKVEIPIEIKKKVYKLFPGKPHTVSL